MRSRFSETWTTTVAAGQAITHGPPRPAPPKSARSLCAGEAAAYVARPPAGRVMEEVRMERGLTPDHSAVRRLRAERYLRQTLIWFALTVIAVRSALAATGYPQLGGGQLHIAHVLWGGLFLFGAALSPLLFANRWALDTSAVLAGIGVGLFIDEVGKFLTQTNDYFFPPAAPIIYAVFLLTLLLYLRVREEPARTVRHDLYAALDNLPHFLDHDLDARRYTELCDQLRHARAHAQDRKLSLLAGALLEAVESEYDELARRPRGRWERWVDRLSALEASWLTLPRMRYLFAAVLLAMGAGAFTDLLVLLWTAILPLDLERAVYIVAGGADEPGGTRLFLLFARFLLAGIVGMLLVLGAVLLVVGRVRAGIASRLLRAPALAHHPQAAGLLLRSVRRRDRGGDRLRRPARPHALSTALCLGRRAERPGDGRRSGDARRPSTARSSPHTKAMRSRLPAGSGIQRAAKKADTPLPNFAGINARRARRSPAADPVDK